MGATPRESDFMNKARQISQNARTSRAAREQREGGNYCSLCSLPARRPLRHSRRCCRRRTSSSLRLTLTRPSNPASLSIGLFPPRFKVVKQPIIYPTPPSHTSTYFPPLLEETSEPLPLRLSFNIGYCILS